MGESSWFEVVVPSVDPDEDCWLFIEAGAASTASGSDGTIHCFVIADALSDFLDECRTLGRSPVTHSPVSNDGWIQKCPEVWEPVTVGSLTILPVQQSTADGRDPGTIRIIPGLGFGTGHHASTQLLIELLQHPTLVGAHERRTIDRALDIGTGSGILALAIARLFSVPVLAFDNDPDAITNAVDNVRMNGEEAHITTLVGTTESLTTDGTITGRYPLVAANLYAELLVQLEPSICSLVKTGGYIVLAGIMTDKLPTVRQQFSSPRWNIIDKRQRPGWVALLIERC